MLSVGVCVTLTGCQEVVTHYVGGVETVVSGAASGCMCDIDMQCVIVVRVVEMSFSGGGDAFASGVDDSVCGVNSVLAAGVLDLCSVDTVLSGAEESVCGVNSVLAAGVLDLYSVDTVVSGVDEPVCGVRSVMTAIVSSRCVVVTA